MAKPGRNDRCPCGSGKKYKACCLTTDEAAERERLAKTQAARDERATEKRQSLREVRKLLIGNLAGSDAFDDDVFDDGLTEASNAVLALIRDGKLAEAEAAARHLLEHYPEVPDGWDRLGMVHEKRGENREAADCYRRVIDFIREHADDFDAITIDDYAARVAKLDPHGAS
jgi:tetratricopeptide (TPR) repeat protein